MSSSSFLTSLYPTTHGVGQVCRPAAGLGDDDCRGLSGRRLRHPVAVVGAVHRSVHEPAPGLRGAARGRRRSSTPPRPTRARRRASTSTAQPSGSTRTDGPFFIYLHVVRSALSVRAAASLRHRCGRIRRSATSTSPSANRCARWSRIPCMRRPRHGDARRDGEGGHRSGGVPRLRQGLVRLGRSGHWTPRWRASFERLRAAALDDDTAIVFLSDHGEEFQDHGRMWHGQSVYGEMVHVPLVVRWPARCRPARGSTSPCSSIDVMPTLLDFSRAAAPARHAGAEPGAAAEDSGGEGGSPPAAWKTRPGHHGEDGDSTERRIRPNTMEAVAIRRRRLEADSQQGRARPSARSSSCSTRSATASTRRTSPRSIPRSCSGSRRRSTAGSTMARRRELKPDAEADQEHDAGATAAAAQPRLREMNHVVEVDSRQSTVNRDSRQLRSPVN